MTNSDNHLWLRCWRGQEIDFHQAKVNALLIQFWSKLNFPNIERVFVPLCGKSLDMIWLLEQGHQVIGVELSPIAVRAFFQENNLLPVKRRHGKFTVWESGKLSILCGDFFSLKQTDLGQIDAVYDRAALTALPEALRKMYVSHLRKIVPNNANVVLLTTEDEEEHQTLVQALGVSNEVKFLYSDNFDIKLAHVESLYEPNPDTPNLDPPRTDYKVYWLTSKGTVT